MHFGIDYGSKLAGTTVICYDSPQGLVLLAVSPKKDADRFLAKHINTLQPDQVFLDAPLSLPGAYFDQGDNFHYRQCDVVAKAMSPMFLGGLTARAMKLRAALREYSFIETYPSLLIKTLFPEQDFYIKKKKINQTAIENLITLLAIPLIQSPTDWHQFDAILAWYSGYRWLQKEHLEIGDAEEGLIIV